MSPANWGPSPGSNNPSLLGEKVRNARASGSISMGTLIFLRFSFSGRCAAPRRS